MRTGNPYRIPPPLDQCEHCGAVFYSPCEAAWCMVYRDSLGWHHEHLCFVHAEQVRRTPPSVISYVAEIPIRVAA